MIKTNISMGWRFGATNGNFATSYENVDLPHDFLINSKRGENPRVGGYMGGFGMDSTNGGEYIKYIKFPDVEHVFLDIDGAYMCARVFLNADMIAMHPHGYTPFLVDLTEYIQKNELNRISVLTSNLQPSSRWYSGAGIYRDVFIWSGGKVRVEPRDLFVKTNSITDDNAEISADITLTSDINTNVLINISICDNDGNKVAVKTAEKKIRAGKEDVSYNFIIKKAKLWDTENPNLYSIKVEIIENDVLLDTTEQNFGIRTIYVDEKVGFLLNGNSIKLRGGCIHHDHGGVGAASFPKAEQRKVKLLKNAGFNALRISHNPPSTALLEVCDKLGMLVMDEAFDFWNIGKKIFDYSLWFADWWARDISYMVLRDRIHPSVISYSIGNEITEYNGFSKGAEWSKKLCEEVRKYDTTRFVTSAACNINNNFRRPQEGDIPEKYVELLHKMQNYEQDYLESFSDASESFFEHMDIAGYNYMYPLYESDSKRYPKRVIWGSETWALTFYKSWNLVKKLNNVIGDFTWTAIDNLGEAGAGRFAWESEGEVKGISIVGYPWRSCYQGDLDLCGYRRPQSYYREMVWFDITKPMLFTTHPKHYGEKFTGTGWHWYDVHPVWTFDDEYLGKPVKVDAYSAAEEVEFYLNGKLIGKSTTKEGIASLDVPYEKGELKAVSYREGIRVGESTLFTHGVPVAVNIVAESDLIKADNRDLAYFQIYVVDKDGNMVYDCDKEITCEVVGGELVTVFSGNPCNEDDYSSNKCHLFYGKALAVVKSTNKGKVELCVSGDGICSNRKEIVAE